MSWFNNLKVSRKFWAVGAFLFPLIILLSGTGVWGATQINSSFQDVRTNQIPAIYQTAAIIQNIQNSQLKIAQLLLELDPHKATLDGTKIPRLISAARDNISLAQKGWETYSTLPAAPEATALIKQFDSDWKIWATEAESLLRLVEQKAPNLQETALSIFDELSNQNQNLENTLLNISTLNYKAALVKADDGVNISQIVILLVIVTATLILLLNLGVGVLLARAISRPLANLKNVTKAIASGDLTQQVKLETQDEVGELGTTFNLTVQSLQSLVKQLHWQSQLISSATQELTSQAKTQVDGSSQQAQYISQATQSLQELNQTAEEIMRQAVNVNKMVALSVAQAQQVSGLSEQMASAQEQGRQTVAQTVTALQNLKEQLADIQNGQQALVEQSWVIRTVTGLIQNLAQETHLLALNAAIEAAGAGEFGTRFAVVAQQIKQLADRSMKATNDVRSTLEGIGTLVERTSSQAKESLDQAERAVVQSGHSDTTLLALSDLSEQVRVAAQEIMRQVEASADLATNIETSTRQQQFASQHMLQRMMEIEAVTAQNLSSIRQEETAIYQLSLTAHDLLESADAFKLVNV